MFRFSNLKIGNKLIFLVALALTVVFAISVISLNNMKKLNELSRATYEKVVIPNTYLRTITNSFATIRVIIRDYPIGILTNDKEYILDDIQTIIDNDKIIQDTFELYVKYVEDNNVQGEEKDYIHGLVQQYKPIRECIMAINDMVLDMDVNQVLSAILDDFDPINTDMRTSLNTLNDINVERASENQLSNEQSYASAFRATIICIGIGVLLLALLAFLTISTITTPIKQLVSIADDVTLGKLNVNINSDSKDELGVLARAFKQLIDTLQNLINDINKMSDEHRLGDMDFRIDTSRYEGAYSEMAYGTNKMIDDYIIMIHEVFACFKELANGDFNAPVKNYPGKKEVITNQVNMLRENLRSIGNEITMLGKSGAEGKLSTRADAARFKGDWKEMLLNLNRLLDNMVTPVSEAGRVLEEISKGNLNVHTKGEFVGDFSIIKDSLDNTAKTLKGYIDEIAYVLTEIAGGNLNLQVKTEYVGDFSRIKTSLNKIINDFNEVVSEINSATEQVRSGAGQLSRASMTLAQGASEQASSIEQLSSSIFRIEEQSNKNTEISERATALSRTTNENATKGNLEMREMLDAMNTINEASNKISKVIKTIDGIAFQTNMLALNAAVEAARAGIHGKGFAVVSEEVRSLANKSKTAAEETTLLIDDSINKVSEGMKIANKTAAVFNDIVNGVTEVSGLVSDIKESSAEQAASIGQVTLGLSQISEVVQNNSATSQESSSASEELSSQAELLKIMVDKFKLK